MVTGVGTDVVEIDRFRRLDHRAEFLAEVFTRTEIHNAPGGSSQYSYFATLFAIKEALLKALACGLGNWSAWQEIQITDNWRPQLSGHLGQLARDRSVSKIHVSHSRSDQNAIAFVLIETTTEEVL
jgi:holo-[acyl-carrier protein] synthase